MVKTSNEKIFDSYLKHQIDLLRLAESLQNSVGLILDSSEKSIRDELIAVLTVLIEREGGSYFDLETKKALMEMSRKINDIRTKPFADILKTLTDQMEELSVLEGSVVAPENITKNIIFEYKSKKPTQTELKNIVKFGVFDGLTLKQWVDSLQMSDQTNIIRIVQKELNAGNRDVGNIVRKVVGTASKYGADGITSKSRSGLAGIIRTVVNGVTHQARDSFYKANPTLVASEIFVATLDSRTTVTCMGFDGETFLVGEGPFPPLHFKCRSLRVPFISGMENLDRPIRTAYKKDFVGMTSRQKRAKIRQLTGVVPGDVDYGTFLKRQSKGFQNEVLGVARADLFRKGKLSLDKFTDKQGNELTLRELKVKYPAIAQ